MEKLDFQNLVQNLVALRKETEWLELKHNNENPHEIGEYISALSNSAALLERRSAYILWGVEDSTCQIIGTNFRPRETKVHGQELESWLIFTSILKSIFGFMKGMSMVNTQSYLNLRQQPTVQSVSRAWNTSE